MTSTTPPARLFTSFGTVLYVDPSGELRHGPIESSPANAVFVAVGGGAGPVRSGSIVHLASGGAEEPIACSAEACRPASSVEGGAAAGGAITLELIAVERSLIALRADGKFLSADPAGPVRLSRPVCSNWECFLAGEAWCAADADALPPASAKQIQFNVPSIKKYVLSPLSRMAMNARPRLKKMLICSYPQWSRNRIYYDLCKQLHRKGYIVDILDLDPDASNKRSELFDYYDLVLTSTDNVPGLSEDYGVPFEKMIVVTHHEMDIRFLIERKGLEVFERFAAYGAASYFVYCASIMQGVRRPPRVTPPGVDYAEFYAEVPTKLESVGFVAPMSTETFGVEWKRGQLSKAAAEQAGLPFKLAGPDQGQASFHDMPAYYPSVDAVLMSSLSEVAQLPVMEAAAAGRLVIGTPVGHFPLKAYQGAGILAPIEPEKFVAFAATTLTHYRERPADFVFKCLAIQEAARQSDWKYCIDDWVALIESA